MWRVFIVFALVFFPSLYRATDIEQLVAHMTGVHWEAFVEVLRNDYFILAPILLLVLITAYARHKILALACFSIAAFFQFLVFMDVLVYEQFAQRLILADTMKYGGYAVDYILDFNVKFLSVLTLGLLVAAFVIRTLWRVLRRSNVDLRMAGITAFLICSTSAAAWQSGETGYVHYRFFQNFISYNRTDLTEYRDYSPDFAAELSDPFAETCEAGPELTGPVLIYMVESLSSYHSKFFSGLNDWTPNLDRLASENLALNNFFANGFTTEDGVVSLVTAQVPIYPPNSMTKGGSTHFSGHWAPTRSLVSAYEAKGYSSYFLTTSTLRFSSTGDWTRTIGFDNVEGSEAAYYEGLPRFHFNAAADEALVKRIIEVVETEDDQTVLFAKTASSHHPFIEPDTGVRSEEQVIRYVDRQIASLHQQLTERGFFEKGHLVIVGDHRAMRPLSSDEVEVFGFDKAYTQIPAVVVGPKLAPAPRVVDMPLSQTDIANSLIGMAKGQICTTPLRGAIWGETSKGADYIIHRRGDQRNQFSVFAGQRLGVVTLNGDATQLTSDGFTAEEKSRIVDFINYKRVMAGVSDSKQALLEK